MPEVLSRASFFLKMDSRLRGNDEIVSKNIIFKTYTIFKLPGKIPGKYLLSVKKCYNSSQSQKRTERYFGLSAFSL